MNPFSFERKLVSHMSKGFDPFKPLSINTSALESSGGGVGVGVGGGGSVANNSTTTASSSSSISTTVKKQSVLYDSLQQHPLASKLTSHQHHQHQHQHHHQISAVDGQTGSRMELHKATLANATIDPIPTAGGNSECCFFGSGKWRAWGGWMELPSLRPRVQSTNIYVWKHLASNPIPVW